MMVLYIHFEDFNSSFRRFSTPMQQFHRINSQLFRKIPRTTDASSKFQQAAKGQKYSTGDIHEHVSSET